MPGGYASAISSRGSCSAARSRSVAPRPGRRMLPEPELRAADPHRPPLARPLVAWLALLWVAVVIGCGQPAAAASPAAASVDSVGFSVSDLSAAFSDAEASLRFYRDLLGLRVVGTSENYGTEQEQLNNVFGAHLQARDNARSHSMESTWCTRTS